MTTENLAHPNYDELMSFVCEVSRAYYNPQSDLKKTMDMLKLVGSPAPEAFQQALIEVRQEDGGFGLSRMTAKEFFNNDLALRQKWANHIAAVFEAYKQSAAESVIEAAKPDPVAEELKALKAQLATMMEAMSKKNMDAMMDEKKDGDEEKAAGGEEEKDEEDKPKEA